jgi:2-polyprenyl-3-methyl-5-hydroxy-6-metoxy-1,4-benzoquinol methylase
VSCTGKLTQADEQMMHRHKSEQEVAIERKWRARLIQSATAEDFQQAYDELHDLFLQEQEGAAEIYEEVNPRGMDNARRAILRKIGSGQCVLEVGCGDGQTSRLLAKQGNEVVSIDISAVALDVARGLASDEGLALEYRYGDARSLDLPDASFDYVVSEHFVEHLSSDDLLTHLAEVRRVLKPGGHYLMATPSRLWNGRRSVGFHLRVYTLAELCGVVRASGLKASWLEPRFMRRFGLVLEVQSPWLWLAFFWERLLETVRIWQWPVAIRGRVIPSVIVSATNSA